MSPEAKPLRLIIIVLVIVVLLGLWFYFSNSKLSQWPGAGEPVGESQLESLRGEAGPAPRAETMADLSSSQDFSKPNETPEAREQRVQALPSLRAN